MRTFGTFCIFLMSACGAEHPETTSVQNVGLATSASTPPLGEGISPASGFGGDGAAVVTGIGGWSGGPGAVKWHGGQWIVPYAAHPGSTIANVSCDVVPRSDVMDTIELVGSNGVIGTSTVPATTANVIIRSWILPTGGYRVADGDQLIVRHTPRDAASGQLTNSSQDMTIISCSAHAVESFTTSFYPRVVAMGGSGPWSQVGSLASDTFDAFIQSVNSNSQVFLEVPAREGDILTGLSLEAEGNGSANCLYILFYGVGMGSQISIGGPNDFARPAQWGNLPIFSGSKTVEAGAGLILFAQSSAFGYRIGKMHATFMTR